MNNINIINHKKYSIYIYHITNDSHLQIGLLEPNESIIIEIPLGSNIMAKRVKKLNKFNIPDKTIVSNKISNLNNYLII
tara:strand:+ start:272 stop:508 length:237 start_codon:yes stop_codon:yes gene_type:complete